MPNRLASPQLRPEPRPHPPLPDLPDLCGPRRQAVPCLSVPDLPGRARNPRLDEPSQDPPSHCAAARTTLHYSIACRPDPRPAKPARPPGAPMTAPHVRHVNAPPFQPDIPAPWQPPDYPSRCYGHPTHSTELPEIRLPPTHATSPPKETSAVRPPRHPTTQRHPPADKPDLSPTFPCRHANTCHCFLPAAHASLTCLCHSAPAIPTSLTGLIPTCPLPPTPVDWPSLRVPWLPTRLVEPPLPTRLSLSIHPTRLHPPNSADTPIPHGPARHTDEPGSTELSRHRRHANPSGPRPASSALQARAFPHDSPHPLPSSPRD